MTLISSRHKIIYKLCLTILAREIIKILKIKWLGIETNQWFSSHLLKNGRIKIVGFHGTKDVKMPIIRAIEKQTGVKLL